MHVEAKDQAQAMAEEEKREEQNGQVCTCTADPAEHMYIPYNAWTIRLLSRTKIFLES